MHDTLMPTMPVDKIWSILNDGAEEICSAQVVNQAVQRLGKEITERLANRYPVVLSVMGGGVVFTGQLLPLLRFPLDFDYVHASRYGNALTGNEIKWKVMPGESVSGRVVLVLDDILDEGHTLAAIRNKLLESGATEVLCAVLANKELGKRKPISADFVGLNVPNRYVFGFGMDVNGAWRNLPSIYALKENVNIT